MLRLTKELLQHIEALKVQIAKHEETLASGIFTTMNEKLEARAALWELKDQLHQAEKSLSPL